MSDKEALAKARRLEELLAEAAQLAEETGCVAPGFISFLRVMERNVMKHYHNLKHTKE